MSLIIKDISESEFDNSNSTELFEIDERNYNEKNNKDENNLVKIMKENKDGENINASTIQNKEKQNSSCNESTIMNINNKLKDIIPEMRIKDEMNYQNIKLKVINQK